MPPLLHLSAANPRRISALYRETRERLLGSIWSHQGPDRDAPTDDDYPLPFMTRTLLPSEQPEAAPRSSLKFARLLSNCQRSPSRNRDNLEANKIERFSIRQLHLIQLISQTRDTARAALQCPAALTAQLFRVLPAKPDRQSGKRGDTAPLQDAMFGPVMQRRLFGPRNSDGNGLCSTWFGCKPARFTRFGIPSVRSSSGTNSARNALQVCSSRV